MKKTLLLPVIILLLSSCSLHPGTNTNHDAEALKYKLHFNPRSDSRMAYEVTNESNMQLEMEGKEVVNRNRSEVDVTYGFEKQPGGNYGMLLQYNKVKVHSKSGEVESVLDAANAGQSINPVERMLGFLLGAEITATVSPKGVVSEVKGYKELGNQLLSSVDGTNPQAKESAQRQWDKTIGEGLIKKNLDQFFTLFPDSTVRVGDKWKLESRQGGEFDLVLLTNYTLKAINDDIALLESEGTVQTEPSSTHAPSLGMAAQLSGTQRGTYELDTKTGLLFRSEIITDLEGTIRVMGREVPVEIQNKVRVKGNPVK